MCSSYNITSRKNHVSVSQEQPGDGVLTSVALMKSLHIKSEVILCAFLTNLTSPLNKFNVHFKTYSCIGNSVKIYGWNPHSVAL